ncbi:MAG: hypothetical protein A2Z83_06935 [Omnitrophica bacterium GWA2_52_8]|nr:MAG: hypothetical protein A2Z83_06935 [Omnitrophica bacterium GWA2_52_8]
MPSENSLKETERGQLRLSRRVLGVSPSATLAITAKANELKAQGINVLSLSAGEPDFDTPEIIRRAAIDAIQKGVTRYTPAAGTLELRKAIANKFKTDQGLTYSPEQIIVSCGAKHSLFNVLYALVDDGDEVLIPAPYWLSYPEMVRLLNGACVFLDTDASTEFKLTPGILGKKLTPKSKVLVLNSPSNPTGAVYSERELLALVEVLKKHPQVWVLSDEIYEKLIFDGKKHISIASLDPSIAARTVIVNGHSKAFAMTGWRLGYAAFPDLKLAKAVGSFQSHSTSNPTSFAQSGGVAALEKPEIAAEVGKMCREFEKRRNYFYEKLSKMPLLKPFCPQGAFYMFVDVSGTGMDSIALTQAWLDEIHVAVVPGQPFGNNRYVRLSFACSEKTLEEAVKRIGGWCEKRKAAKS